MKRLFLLILFVCTTLCYSQTSTKKYNDLRNRWEYYNSSGQMVGYEKYNSLREQWEYTDLSQNVSSRVHDYGNPQSTFDADLAFRALAAKQRQYNKNQQSTKRLLTRIGEVFEDNNRRLNSLDNREKAKEIYTIVGKKWKKYIDQNFSEFNYSNVSIITNHIYRMYNDATEKVNKKYQKISNLKTDETIKILLSGSLRSATMGGYTSTIIVEYIWNTTTEQFEFDRELNINSKVYFDKNYYAFKRGDNTWKYANWTFLKEQKNTGEYVYYDNYGQNLVINFTEHTATWYMNKKNGVWTKAVVWGNLKSSPTVKPE